MNWFFRWLQKRIERAHQEQYANGPEAIAYKVKDMNYAKAQASNMVGSSGSASLHAQPTFNFQVTSAIGGKVVEFRRYDPRTDRHDTTVYVIPEGEDFGQRIAKICTLEALKG